MALSGSVNYSQNRDSILTDAMQTIGVASEAETPSDYTMQAASRVLNRMVKAMQADGLQLFARKTGTLFLQKDKTSYNLGTGSYATKDTDYVWTQLNGALAASATAVTTDTTTGMTVADNIGIVLTDNTIHWDTIATIPSSTTLTLTTGVASAASDDAYVMSFTNQIDRPLRIIHSVLKDTSNIDLPMYQMPMMEYRDLPDKTSGGLPTQFYFDPQLTDAILYPWPRQNSDNYRLEFVYLKPYDDLDNATDDFEFPQEWYQAIVYGLAALLADVNGLPLRERSYITARAREYKQDVMGFDVENASLHLQPNTEY